jgi:hypothetical protein
MLLPVLWPIGRRLARIMFKRRLLTVCFAALRRRLSFCNLSAIESRCGQFRQPPGVRRRTGAPRRPCYLPTRGGQSLRSRQSEGIFQMRISPVGRKTAALGLSLALLALGALGAPARAADAAGCKDDPALKRFEGSSIVLCKKKDFEAFKLPTGPMKEWNFDKKTPNWMSALDVEGALTQNVYQIKKGPRSLP